MWCCCGQFLRLERAQPWGTITTGRRAPPTLFAVNTVGRRWSLCRGPVRLLKQHYDCGLFSARLAYLVRPSAGLFSSTAHAGWGRSGRTDTTPSYKRLSWLPLSSLEYTPSVCSLAPE